MFLDRNEGTINPISWMCNTLIDTQIGGVHIDALIRGLVEVLFCVNRNSEKIVTQLIETKTYLLLGICNTHCHCINILVVVPWVWMKRVNFLE